MAFCLSVVLAGPKVVDNNSCFREYPCWYGAKSCRWEKNNVSKWTLLLWQVGLIVNVKLQLSYILGFCYGLDSDFTHSEGSSSHAIVYIEGICFKGICQMHTSHDTAMCWDSTPVLSLHTDWIKYIANPRYIYIHNVQCKQGHGMTISQGVFRFLVSFDEILLGPR